MIDARIVKSFPADGSAAPFELNIHLRAPAGVTALFGDSGAGKTLALNCIAGFTRPTQGRILINEELVFDAATRVHVPPRHRRCGYVFQDHALFPHKTIRENLRFASAASPQRQTSLNRRRRINELLEAFELSEMSERRPDELSGGQRQRAAVARVLAGDPQALLLDEPASALDQRLRQGFHQVLRMTRQRLNVPIVMVTHDLAECFEIADMVCLMRNGRISQSGPAAEVLRHPASVEIARSLGIYNLFPATIKALDPGRDSSLLTVFEDEVQGPYLPGHLLGDRGILCIPQSECRLVADAGKPQRNQVRIKIREGRLSPLGIRVSLDHDASATLSEAAYAPLKDAERVRLEIPPAAVCFIGY
jgi:molybdate transport system ATP-binding protein